MKLGKLLAAGKSIMNGHTEISYRSSKQIYLPKFGSSNNPFKSEASPQAEIMPAVETARPASGTATIAASTNAIATTLAPAIEKEPGAPASGSATIATERPCVPPCPSASVTQPTKTPPAAASEANLRKAPASKQSESGSTIQRFNALLCSALGRARGSEKSQKNQKGTATQTELSLDSVKVVHNDLSDVDVEVVPIKSRSGAPELPTPKKSWEYVGERLFGVEAT